LLKLLSRHCVADKSTTRQSPRTLSGPRPGGLRQSLVGTVQWNSDITCLQPPSCDNNSRSRGGGGWSMGIMNGRMAGLRYRSSSCAVSIDTANHNCRSLIVLTTNEQHAPKKSKNYRMLALNVTICYLRVVRLCTVSITATHTHTVNGPFQDYLGKPVQKGKTNVDFTEATDNEWQWHQLGHVCTSLQTDNHASTPPLSFLEAGCPSCRPTNSVKALKALSLNRSQNSPQTNNTLR